MSQEALPPFSSLAQSVVIGSQYEHYKGLRYKIIGIARHSETLEELVVYQALYENGEIWVRPLSMFVENIVLNGQTQPRFRLVLDPWGNTIGSADDSKKQEKPPLIRPLIGTDIPKIVSRYSFPWSTPEKTRLLWDAYYQEQQEGIRTVAVFEANREILGYGSLLRKPESPFFAQKNIPEINAIWIDENHRRQGLGSALIGWIEKLASKEGYQQIGIGVGLYKDYGPAQRLYFRLGYSPDGNGISYKGVPTVAGETYPLDDDLLLWLVKSLSS